MNVSKYHLGGLYIKLDKKLTLKTNYIVVPQRKSSPSFNNINETFENVKYLLTFFDVIELKNIKFQNNALSIMFNQDYLKITSKDYSVIGTVYRAGKMLYGKVPYLHLNETNITLAGDFTYDLQEDNLETKGKFIFNEVRGKFTASKRANQINFSLKSDTFSQLRPIIDMFHLPKGVYAWVVDKVQAKKYELLFFKGKGNIDHGIFTLDIDSLQGMADLSEVKIYFQKNIQPVNAKTVLLNYKDGGLSFILDKPIYRGKNLEGSKVSIVNLTDQNTTLKLDLHIQSPFDKRMKHLLKSYDLNIPVLQTTGTMQAVFKADIGLKNSDAYFITDIDFTQGDVWIEKVKLPIQKGNLRYEDGFIVLKDVHLKNEFYEGMLHGKIDLKKEEAKLVFDADKVKLSSKDETIFSLKNRALPFTLKYENALEVKIPKLAITFKRDTNASKLICSDLSKVKQYLPVAKSAIDGGNVAFKTKDFKTFSFKGILKRHSCFLYENRDTCLTRVPFEGTITPKEVKFYAFNKKLSYQKSKSRVTLKNLNIDLEKLLENQKQTSKNKNKGKKLVIIGKNSHLRYEAYNLITDSYDIEVKANGDIKATASSSGDIIKFTKKKDTFSLQALRIKDKVLHPLINFKGLQKGRYSLKKSGNPKGTMKGEIIVEGGVMKDFKAYNNTLAFINTLPALAVLHSPGYSQEGFTIKEGVAKYKMIANSRIIFDSVYIKGTAATIVGKGEIDLKRNTINMHLAIQVARELGKIVGNLPLLGYILMGEDKSMTVGLKISGSLDKPVVNTTATSDILSLPFDLIKRTFQSPAHIINQ